MLILTKRRKKTVKSKYISTCLLTYVLTQYRMDQYLELEYRHYKTNDGSKSSSTENLRSYYFSNITCAQFEKLKIVYQMDLDIFDYSDEPFRSFCV